MDLDQFKSKPSYLVDVTPGLRRSVRRRTGWLWQYFTSKIVTFSINLS